MTTSPARPFAEPPARIVLVGFMGAGKSTIGPLLARLLGWEFRDLDAWIEGRHGVKVSDLFRDRGEPFFREEERQAALETHHLARHVIAAGGGAFAQEATREALRQGAATVWLRCDIDTALDRIPSDGSRPLAANRERMRSLLVEREASYRLADLTVDTTDGPPDEVARRIQGALFGPQSVGTIADR